MIQYYLCQKFGHKANSLTKEAGGIICGGHHKLADCTVPRDSPKSANCQGDHAASHRGCSSSKAEIAMNWSPTARTPISSHANDSWPRGDSQNQPKLWIGPCHVPPALERETRSPLPLLHRQTLQSSFRSKQARQSRLPQATNWIRLQDYNYCYQQQLLCQKQPLQTSDLWELGTHNSRMLLTLLVSLAKLTQLNSTQLKTLAL